MDKTTKIIISIILIALGVACRILPHLGNFAPIAAIAIFAGFYLGRSYAVFLPIAAMALGDLFIGFYSLPLMLVVYGSYVITGLVASLIKKHKNVEVVMAASIFASVLFFIATNFAVWQFASWYTKDLLGLVDCFIAAIPFFRATLLGDLFYTGIFVGAYEGIKFLANFRQLKALTVKNS